MYLLAQIDSEIETTKNTLERQAEVRSWVDQNQERFTDLPTASLCGDYIDFDNLTHAEIMTVILRFGGKWDRTPNNGKINYTRRKMDDCPLRIRCYNGTPPPGCRIEYEEVTVPAQPARVERRAKLNCKPLQELVDEAKSLPAPVIVLENSEADDIPF